MDTDLAFFTRRAAQERVAAARAACAPARAAHLELARRYRALALACSREGPSFRPPRPILTLRPLMPTHPIPIAPQPRLALA